MINIYNSLSRGSNAILKNERSIDAGLSQNKSTVNKTSRLVHLFVLFCIIFTGISAKAQIGVTVTNPSNTTPALAASYTDLTTAVAALNGVTAMSGPVVFTLAAGTTETAPVKGFNISTATAGVLNSTNTLTITKAAGSSTVITAGVGTANGPSASPDGMMYLSGSDYVTINGLTFTDGNTASATVAMEFGIAFFKRAAGDGCNNNTIQNCTFNMQRINNASGTTPMFDGSWAIEVLNSTAAAAVTALTPTNGGTLATNGTNSNNKFFSNTINNGNGGIGLAGYAASSGVGPTPNATTFLGDLNNDIGGSTSGTGNIILNFGGATAASNPSAGIRANNEWSLNIQYNYIDNNDGAGVNHPNTLRGIYGQAGTSANVTISNNTISLKSAATTSVLTGIENVIGGTSASNTVTMNNNVIQNCTYTTATTATFTGILAGASAATQTMNNNQVSNNTIGASGTASSCTFQGIYSSVTNTTTNMNSNTVSDNQLLNSWGTMYCMRGSTATMNVDGNTVTNNSFPNSAGGTSSTFIGIYNVSGPAVENYTNNNINNLTITGSSTATGNIIQGIAMSTASGAKTISGNNVNTLIFTSSSTGSSTVTGIRDSYANVANIFKNVIHTLSSTGASPTVQGIQFGAITFTTANVYNNIIGNLDAPQSTGHNLFGIWCGSVGTTYNISFNTVYLKANSAAGGSASSALFMSSTAPSVVLKSNIFINLSTGTTTWLSTAIRRTAAALTSYGSASNNNLVYCGTPSTTNAIYYDGTNTDLTLGAFKARVTPRETASVTETISSTPGVFFQSLTGPASGSITNFLHIVNAVPTQAEGGGITVSGITDDYDGAVRNVTTPDIGADEFNGSPAPSMTFVSSTTEQLTGNAYLATANQAIIRVKVVTTGVLSPLSLTNFTLNANGTTSIGDINASTAKVYYTGASNTFSTAALFGATTPTIANFTVAGSQVLAEGDNYFWLAYDVIAGATPGNFIDGECMNLTVSTVQIPAITAPAGNKVILGPMSGTYTVGSGGSFTSLTNDGGAFEALNLTGASSNITLNITSDLTGELGTNALNQIAGGFTVLIKPSGAPRAITGSNAAALIKLNGADNVTIDGSTSGGTDQSLTITNGNGSSTAISIISLGVGLGATGNTVKNCVISTGVASAVGYGIAVGGSSPGSSGADNDNTTIQNNSISAAPIGIYAVGTAAVTAGGDDNLNITGNTINYNGTVASIGIQVGNALNSNVNLNTISEETTAAQAPSGITLETGFVSSLVSRNNITKALTTNTGGYGGRGIAIGTGTATSNLTVANNFISGINGSNWSGFTNSSSMGICVGCAGNSTTLSTTTGGVNLYYNSVNMYGTFTSTTNCLTAALYVGSGASALDIRNNILVNGLNNIGTGTASKAYAIYSAVANTAYANINYNDYAVSGSQAVLGFLTSDRTNLAGIVTGFGQNASSLNIAPVFVSNSDLHLNTLSNNALDNLGTFIAAVTIDYDGTTRSGSTPDMGADEFAGAGCTGAVGGTATGTATICGPVTSPTITATGYSTGTGSGYQWQYSNNNFVSDINDFGGQTSPTALTTGLISATTYYRLKVTCPTGTATAFSNIITITINPVPAVTTVAGAGTFCGSTTITASGGAGGTIYFQGTTSGGTSTAIPSTSQSITVSGTYYFRAYNGTCWGTEGSAAVTINANPTGVTASASVANACPGVPFNLFSSSDAPTVAIPIVQQNFESGLGSWTATNASTGGVTPAAVIWTVQTAPYTFSGTGTPEAFTVPQGVKFAMANSDAGGNGSPTLASDTSLTSPAFSTVGYATLSLSFKHYFRYISPSSGVVEVSTDGTNWTGVQTYGSLTGTAAAFASATINLNAYVGNPTVYVRFHYLGAWSWYWAVDDIAISGIPGSNTYSWTSVPAGFTSSVQNPTGVTQSVPRTYKVKVTSSTGCFTENTVVVGAAGCSSVVNLKLYIEGYYEGAGLMRSVKNLQDGVSPLTDVENVTVELHSASTPYGVLHTTTALLKTDGTAVATFASAPTGSFYISVANSNAIKTWSKTAQTVGGTTSYNFSDAITKSYGDNMQPLGGGLFGFYSGDLNQDGSIDGSDAPDLFDDVDNSEFGVQITDLNGDGSVDNSDVPLFLDNSDASIYSHDPNNP